MTACTCLFPSGSFVRHYRTGERIYDDAFCRRKLITRPWCAIVCPVLCETAPRVARHRRRATCRPLAA